MNSYDPIITLKKAFANGGATTLLGCVLFAAFQWFSANGFPTTPEEWKAAWPVILSGIAAASFAAVKNWAKNRGTIDPDARDPRTGLPPAGPVVILCLIGAAATFSGCITVPSLSPNGQSGNTLVAEKDVKPDGAQHFKIAIKQHGEATKEGTIDYSSGGPDPATFRIAGNASVDSSRLKPLLEGEGAALANLPETIAGLMDVLKAIPDAAPGTPGAGLKEQIIKAFIERMLGRVLTPGGGQ